MYPSLFPNTLNVNKTYVIFRRSTARLSSGQRTALNDIEEVHSEERDGQTYIVYEHTTQVRSHNNRVVSIVEALNEHERGRCLC